jgi:hypothetical protein
VLHIEGLVLLPLACQEIEQHPLGWLTRDISCFENDLPRDWIIMLQEGLANSFASLGVLELPESLLSPFRDFGIPIATGSEQMSNYLRPAMANHR